jgi:hypothetical protein
VVAPGQGGRAVCDLPVTGAGVGVGRGVGRTVGRGVGWAVGLGVAWAVGWGVGATGVGVETRGVGVAVGTPGVGVGITATIGPPLGEIDAVGKADGTTADGSTDGTTPEELGSGVAPLGVGVAAEVALGAALAPTAVAPGREDGAWLPAAAIPLGGGVGATKPAVSATVARMRLRSPMATTKRAR